MVAVSLLESSSGGIGQIKKAGEGGDSRLDEEDLGLAGGDCESSKRSRRNSIVTG